METQKCPSCNQNTLNLIIKPYEEKFFGKIFLFTSICENCGYKHNDIFHSQQKEPSCYKIVCDELEDLFARVIKSSSATLILPELKVKIEPGPYSQALITNTEGILERVENILKAQLENTKDKKRKRILNLLKKIKKMRNGEERFTLIIKDPTGNSGIISPKAKQRKLTKKEIEKLKSSFLEIDIESLRELLLA